MSEKTKPIHKRIISALMRRGYFDWMNDAAYLKLKYKIAIGRKLDLKNPQTFNEKLQWLKLHDRKAIYTTMVDKYAVKEYVASIIGEEHVIPTLGVWDSFDEIDFDLLPDQFVLKCTHDSGGLVICKDKSKLDINEAKRKIEKSLKTNYYLQGREWPYKDVPRRIIAEKYMVDESGTELRDYKIHNFNGVPRMILVCRDRFEKSGLTEDFYSEKWEHLDIKRPSHPNAEYPQEIPAALQKMLNLSKKLAQDIPFVRTDFYVVGNHIYFGEMTFFPASGMERFEPPVVDEQLGKWLVICGGGYILKGNGFYLWIHENESGDECQDFTNKELLDYKLMCFDGKVRCSFVCSDRFSEDGLKVTFFDNDWNMLPFERHYPKSSKPIAKPESFKKMVEFAEKLSQNIPFVRVDFYEVNGNLYFGELTFYPGSGMEEFRPESADYDLGQMIKLPVIGGVLDRNK